jgi:hypothetical protein
MTLSTYSILDILAEYGVHPEEDEFGDIDLPGIGEIREEETIYATSIEEIF